jgi:hypothetical protein
MESAAAARGDRPIDLASGGGATTALATQALHAALALLPLCGAISR